MKKIILFVLVMNQLSVFCQEIESANYQIHLQSGSKLKGEILEWDYETKLVLKTEQGAIFTFPAEAIKKVIDLDIRKEKPVKIPKPYKFKERGLYGNWKVEFILGNTGIRGNGYHGYGVSGVIGHRWNRWLGVGVGTGYQRWAAVGRETTVPLFVELQGYIKRLNFSPYYSLAMGYGFGLTNEDYGITDASGGVMVYPALGFRFGNRSLKYTVDLGYLYQKASFEYRRGWWSETIEEVEITYKRLALRFGVQF